MERLTRDLAVPLAPSGAVEWPKNTGTIIDLVGDTPLLRLHDLVPSRPRVEVWAKLERYNPGGSIKDRPAAMMILDGLARKTLRSGHTILDSTSGNTGVALAMVGRALGYQVLLCMSDGVSTERKQTLRAFGIELVLTDPTKGSDGAILQAMKIRESNPDRYFMPDQYNNPANPLAHYLTTGPEIWRQTKGTVTHLVAAIGTSGTVMGTGRYLRQHNPKVQIIAVEPDRADHGLNGMRHMPSSIQPRIYKKDGVDRTMRVTTSTAYELARTLARTTGLFVGASSAAVLAATQEIAREETEAVVVAICPDGGSTYLSTSLFDTAAAR